MIRLPRWILVVAMRMVAGPLVRLVSPISHVVLSIYNTAHSLWSVLFSVRRPEANLAYLLRLTLEVPLLLTLVALRYPSLERDPVSGASH